MTDIAVVAQGVFTGEGTFFIEGISGGEGNHAGFGVEDAGIERDVDGLFECVVFGVAVGINEPRTEVGDFTRVSVVGNGDGRIFDTVGFEDADGSARGYFNAGVGGNFVNSLVVEKCGTGVLTGAFAIHRLLDP